MNRYGAGALAGITGGITLDAFLGVAAAPAAPLAGLVGMWSFVGGVAAGTGGHQPGNPLLGLVVHFIVSAAWGVGFAYLVAAQPQVMRVPWLAGIGYGFVVWFLMNAVLVGAALFTPFTPASLGIGVLAHTVFFGLPIALVTARLLDR